MENQLDFNSLDSEELIDYMVETIYQDMFDSDKKLRKEVSKGIIQQMARFLQDKDSGQAIKKFYTMLVLKQLILKRDSKLVSLLNSSSLLEMFEKIALETDPKKNLSEKGANYFKKAQDRATGIQFMRILLETLNYLGKVYPQITSTNQPTKFKKILSNLQQNGVVLPQEFKFYPNSKKGDHSKAKVEEKPAQKQVPLITANELKFVRNKIDDFIAQLDEAAESQDIDEMNKLIKASHVILVGEKNKFLKYQSQAASLSTTAREQYQALLFFLETEEMIYNEEIPKADIQSYFNRIGIAYQILNPEYGQQQQATPQPKIDKMKENSPKESEIKKSSVQQKREIKRQSRIQQNSRAMMKNEETMSKIGKTVGAKSILGIFEGLQSKSKSPINGFSLVKQSLQKEKNKIHVHPPRTRNPATRTVASTLTKTGMKLGSIFKHPPNQAPPYKNYQGELVLACKQLQNVFYDIKKQQGGKRFKIANFRNRYPLFENQSLQVGYKSEAIFEQNEDGFNEILSLELFFGNKSSRQLKNMEIVFEGDENSLVYTNPRDFPSYIEGQKQIKFELMIVPLKVPCGFLKMKLMYQNLSQSYQTTIALPNSIIKMSEFVKIDRGTFQEYWKVGNVKLKTDQFELSHHMPPNSLEKYIPQLACLTQYEDFATPGSKIDYELICLVDIMKDYQTVLKINIRPDLKVVLQAILIDPSEDALKYVKFFVQTLQAILQENGL